MKQSQVVALVSDRKKALDTALTSAYHAAQKADSFLGTIKTFTPITEGELAPPTESKRVASRVSDLIAALENPMRVGCDTVLTQDTGNCQAVGNVSVESGGRKLTLANVPVSHLLYLEKLATSIITLIDKLPVLDENQQWTLDGGSSLFKSEVTTTVRTRKAQRALQLIAPTKEHPGQAVQINEDIPSVSVSTVNTSGAIPKSERDALRARAVDFKDAIVSAREAANQQEVKWQTEGEEIFRFLFGE